jgi:hypothetical protein
VTAVVVQFESGTRILRVTHGQDARATSPNRISTGDGNELDDVI